MSKDKVQNIIENSNIVDVISRYVKLEKKGKNFFGICPFHQDTTPSMSVSQEKGIYKCFSCGATGNSVTFIQEHENKSFKESIKMLAEFQGTNIEFAPESQEEKKKKQLFKITNQIKEFYKHYLTNSKSGLVAQEYLKDRNLSKEIQEKFDIGLAPKKGDVVFKGLEKQGYTNTEMLDSGVVRKSENYYDYFRDRIIFPIKDEFSNVVGYSGRVYKESNANEAKYINSSESILFKKTNILYNLDLAKKSIKQEDKVYVYEGFMDVIAVSNAGINNAVAIMGTAMTRNHVEKITKFTKNVILCLDGDEPGINATIAAISILKKHNVDIKIVVLPKGLDPDDYINQKGTQKYLDYINNKSIDELDFRYRVLKRNVNMNSIMEKENFKKDMFNILKEYNSRSILEIYFNKMSKELSISKEALQLDFEDVTKKNPNVIQKNIPGGEPNGVPPMVPEHIPNGMPSDIPMISNNNFSTQKVEKSKIEVMNGFEKADIELNKYMMIDKTLAYKINKELGSLSYNKYNASIRYKIVDFYDNKKINKLSQNNLEKIISPEELLYFNKKYTVFHDEVNLKAIDDCIKTIKQYAINKMHKDLKKSLKDSNKSMEEKIKIGNRIRELTIKKQSLEKKR